MPVIPLTAVELHGKLQAGAALLLLDVREPYEYRYAHIAGSRLLPLQQLPSHLEELPKTAPIVVICHHGVRSRQAAEFLLRHDFGEVYNLSGGIDAWSLDVDAAVPRY